MSPGKRGICIAGWSQPAVGPELGALYAEQGGWQCQAGNQCTGTVHGIQWGRRGCRAATGGSRMQDSGQRRGEGRWQGPGRGLLAFLPPMPSPLSVLRTPGPLQPVHAPPQLSPTLNAVRSQVLLPPEDYQPPPSLVPGEGLGVTKAEERCLGIPGGLLGEAGQVL